MNAACSCSSCGEPGHHPSQCPALRTPLKDGFQGGGGGGSGGHDHDEDEQAPMAPLPPTLRAATLLGNVAHNRRPLAA